MASSDRMYSGGTNTYGNTSDINKSLDIVSNNFKSLANLTESEYKAKLVNLGVEGKYIEALMKYQDEVDDLANQTENASTQIENAARAIAALKIGDGGSSPSTVETQTILAANDYKKTYKKERQELYDKYTGSGISKASGNENPIYKEMLRELQGIEGYEIVRYRDDYRIFCNDMDTLEHISYTLQEVLESLNFRMNSNKTRISQSIVMDSLKADKLWYIENTPIFNKKGVDFDSFEKHLFYILMFGRRTTESHALRS